MADIETPPPHLLKKFSAEARDESNKRNGAGYLKTFAKLCIDWALNSKSSPNNPQIRSSDLDVTIALVQQWTDEIYGGSGAVVGSDDICLANLAAQYGADQELEACCEWVSQWRCLVGGSRPEVGLRAARRPKPPSLNSIALQMPGTIERDAHYTPEITDTIRRALEALDD